MGFHVGYTVVFPIFRVIDRFRVLEAHCTLRRAIFPLLAVYTFRRGDGRRDIAERGASEPNLK